MGRDLAPILIVNRRRFASITAGANNINIHISITPCRPVGSAQTHLSTVAAPIVRRESSYTRKRGEGDVDADGEETRSSRGSRQPITLADCGPTRSAGGEEAAGEGGAASWSRGAVRRGVRCCRCHLSAA